MNTTSSKPSNEDNDKRVINKMIETYNKVNDDMELNDEVKVILKTIKAGFEESRQIHKEPNNDNYFADIDQFIFSCVAAKCLYGEDDIESVHPNFIGGYRIKALLKAILLLKTADLIEQFKCDEGPFIHQYYYDEAEILFDKLNLAEVEL